MNVQFFILILFDTIIMKSQSTANVCLSILLQSKQDQDGVVR